MERRTWFAALGAMFAGRAMAQSHGITVFRQGDDLVSGLLTGKKLRHARGVVRRDGSYKLYLDDHCPECDTEAEPFVRPLQAIPDDLPYGPMEHITRCRVCNNAFFQTAKE